MTKQYDLKQVHKVIEKMNLWDWGYAPELYDVSEQKYIDIYIDFIKDRLITVEGNISEGYTTEFDFIQFYSSIIFNLKDCLK